MLNKVSFNILGQELGHGTFCFRVNCKTKNFNEINYDSYKSAQNFIKSIVDYH